MAPKRRQGKSNKGKSDKQSQDQKKKKVSLNDVKNSFTATLKMDSDWHIGIGAGRPGEIDRLIQRDTDGLPFVPAKTLTGIWRDACELVAFGLDNGSESGVWAEWVNYLFGDQPAIASNAVKHSPRTAALSVRAATFSDKFKQAVSSKPSLLAAMTFIKPGIAIKPETGCAKEDFLRFEEMVRAGASLSAKCAFDCEKLDEKQKMTAYALLTASTRMIERLGGKRRRGAGKCNFYIDKSETIDRWIRWLKTNPQPPAPPSVESANDDHNPKWSTSSAAKDGEEQSAPQSSATNSAWLGVPLRITALTPLVISSRTLGNVVETLDYIPGSHLLRLIVQRLRTLGVDVGLAIANKELVITNATLEINHQHGLPVPLALFGTKLGGGLAKEGNVYNRLIVPEPGKTQLKGEKAGYIAMPQMEQVSSETVPEPGEEDEPKKLHFGKPETAIITHNTIEDAYQRPTQAVGGVYSYQAIKAGTVFRAELRLAKSVVESIKKKDWQDRLSGPAKIGQSKKDSYGQVDISVLSKPQAADTTLELSQQESATANTLTVWLLSDLLLRDDRLRQTLSPTALGEALADYLECSLSLRKEGAAVASTTSDSGEQFDNISAIARSHRVESWQVRWGLPRPSLPGISAGSCFVFEYVGENRTTAKKLAELMVRGIGDRCAEGFGQIALDPPLLTTLPGHFRGVKSSMPDQSSVDASKPLSQQGSESDYARIIQEAAWRDAIHKAAQSLSASEQYRKDYLGFEISRDPESGQLSGRPTMSQIGSLRSMLGHLQISHKPASTGNNSVTTWLNHIQHESRIDRWPEGSPQKFSDLLTEQTLIWQVLSHGLSDCELPPFEQMLIVKNSDRQLRDALWAESVSVFINTCIRAHKRTIEQHDEEQQGGTEYGTAA
ncbi:MAG: RAMP superfamily CRISPR-associated protein [Cyanobacteria bacterium J06627_28]